MINERPPCGRKETGTLQNSMFPKLCTKIGSQRRQSLFGGRFLLFLLFCVDSITEPFCSSFFDPAGTGFAKGGNRMWKPLPGKLTNTGNRDKMEENGNARKAKTDWKRCRRTSARSASACSRRKKVRQAGL